MKERIVQFGDNKNLVGILTLPLTQTRPAGPAVLLLNAGIVHRVGPNRLNVKLARAAAANGYPALRFDLSGLGDSGPSRSTEGHAQQAVTDIRLAVNVLLGQTEASSVAGFGICSGADNLYAAALADDRLSGMLLHDPYAYPTTEAWLRYVATRSIDVTRWKRKIPEFLSAAMQRAAELPGGAARSVATGQAPAETNPDDDRPLPPLEEFGGNLLRLANRGMRISLTYSGGVAPVINTAQQFFNAFKKFDLDGKIDVTVLEHVDHTFTRIASQSELIGMLLRWLDGIGTATDTGNRLEGSPTG